MSDQSSTQPQTVVNVRLDNTNYATAGAAASASATSASAGSPKSTLLAYLAFAFGGWAAGHRLYLQRPIVRWLSFFYLPLWIGTIFGLGRPVFFLAPLLALAADAFAIPRWVRRHNGACAHQAASSGPAHLLQGLGADALGSTPPAPPPIPVEPSRSEKAQDLRTRLLEVAHKGDGKLTVTQAVMETGEGFAKVERALRKMVRAGYIDVDNEPNSGVVVYLFPELIGRPRA